MRATHVFVWIFRCALMDSLVHCALCDLSSVNCNAVTEWNQIEILFSVAPLRSLLRLSLGFVRTLARRRGGHLIPI